MTDHLANLEAQPESKRIGYGNAMFLADLAEGVPNPTLRANMNAGRYPDLHRPSVRGWMAMAGRNDERRTK